MKADVPGGADIRKYAAQVVNYYNPTTKKVEKPNKPTEKRVNNVPIQMNLTSRKLFAGSSIKANEFTFQLLDDDEFNVLETATND